MQREKILIDQTVGKKKLDTMKMDEWTAEDWEEFFPPEGPPAKMQFDLVQHIDLSLKIDQIYCLEVEDNMYIEFEVQNKMKNNICIRFGKWWMDDKEFDLSEHPPILIPTPFKSFFFTEHVHYMFFKHTIAMEIDILDANSHEILKAYDIKIKIWPE